MKRLMPKSKIYLIGAGLLCVGVLLGTVLDGSSMVEAASSYWTFLNKNIYNNNAKNVGIGMTSPQAKLHVAGGTYLANNDQDVLIGDDVGLPTDKNRTKVVFGQSDADTEVILAQDATHGILFKWMYSANPDYGVGIFETYGGNNPLVLQYAGGNVGIGTTAAVYNLTMIGEQAGFYVDLDSTADTITLEGDGGSNGQFTIQNDRSGGDVSIFAGDTVSLGVESYDPTLYVDGGKVGIGTTAPQVSLEVTSMIKSTPTDSAGLCDSNREGTIYYDASMNELCYCNGSSWAQVDGGGGCT